MQDIVGVRSVLPDRTRDNWSDHSQGVGQLDAWVGVMVALL